MQGREIYIRSIEFESSSDKQWKEVSNLDLGEAERARLKKSGFKKYSVFNKDKFEVLLNVASKALVSAEIMANEIDAIILASAFGDSHVVKASDRQTIDSYFQYSAMMIREKLGLSCKHIYGLSQLGCISLHASMDLASRISGDNIRNVLCISIDQIPENVSRYVLHSIVSDSCGVLVTSTQKKAGALVLKSYDQVSNSYYWDTSQYINKLEASYYPTSRRLIKNVLANSNLDMSDIRYIMPNNVSQESWQILADSLGIDFSKIYLETLSEQAHTVSLDSFLNLKNYIDNNNVRNKEKFMFFGFGFGAFWCAGIMEYYNE